MKPIRADPDVKPASLRRLSGRAGAWLTLVAAMLAATGLILWWSGDRTFVLDEWGYVVGRSPWGLEELLRPANGHLIALPLAIYQGVLVLFGATSHLPLTLMTIALHLSVVGLLYAIASRRLGPWPALLPAALILFLGSGWEVMINTASMQNQFGIVAGLGAFICLDRLGRRGDPLAGLLLAASIASFSIGLAFALGAGGWILIERARGEGLRRLWVVLAPVVLYVVWFAWARKYHQESTSASAIAAIGRGSFDQLSAIVGGVSGLFRSADGSGGGSGSAALTVLLLGLIAARIVRGPRLGPARAAALLTLAGYLTLVSLGLSELRSPESSRYVYMGSVLLVLAVVELAPKIRLARSWAPMIGLVAGLAVIANVAEIKYGGDFIERESSYDRAELGALELARSEVDPSFIPEPAGFSGPGYGDLQFRAVQYFSSVDRFGSPADSESEIGSESEPVRAAADQVSAAALGVSIETTASRTEGAVAPTVNGSSSSDLTTRGPCLVVKSATDPELVAIVVPTGGVSFHAESVPSSISVGRFSAGLPVQLQATTKAGTLSIPADASSVPWRAAFQFTGRARLCT